MPKAKASHAHHAMAQRHRAATDRLAKPALRAKAKVAVLTTVAMARAVVHAMVHVLKVAALAVVAKVAVKAVAKTVVATMATSCHDTSTP